MSDPEKVVDVNDEIVTHGQPDRAKPIELNRRTFVKAAASAVASLASISLIFKKTPPVYAQGPEGGGVTQYGPNAEPG